MRHIWQLDDTHYWHVISSETLRLLDNWELRSFFSGRDLLYGLEECAENAELWPSIILMDFYLNGERGDKVTQAIRAFQHQQKHVTIVGFSSVKSCSQQIVQCGGDTVLTKRETGNGINHHLLDYLQEYPL